MILDSIKQMLMVFLTMALMVSCHKESLRVSNSAYLATNQPVSPPASTSGRVFNFLSPSSYPVSGYTTGSSYILYDNGGFVLEYHNGRLPYRGKYKEVNNLINFEWEGWSTAGPWGATGALRGDTMTIAYNEVMTMTDFEDALYLKKQ